MKLIPCSAIWDNILLPVLCGESSSDDSKKDWEKGQEIFVFLLFVLFCLEVCPAPKKAVHSKEKNNEHSLFIASVLVLVFISYI